MYEDYEFEWDRQKAEANLEKLGKGPEDRWLAIARLGPRVYMTAIIAYREERIRLISARFSTKQEIERYHRGR